MKELIKMWENTRMVVLVALIAALYAAILIPFKVAIPVIPGITEFRPANVIPIICSLMFGPAAAWGAAFGNLIGDFFGTLGLGSIFGFIGNFFYGFIPYKIWGRMGIISSKSEPEMNSFKQLFEYVLIALLASLCCAVIIGWGLDLLGMVPFAALGNIIFLNNFVVSIILGPIILKILYPRVKRWGLLYTQIMTPEEISKSRLQLLGIIFIWVGSLIGFVVGNLISAGVYKTALLSFGFAEGVKGEMGLAFGLLSFIILILLSILFL